MHRNHESKRKYFLFLPEKSKEKSDTISSIEAEATGLAISRLASISQSEEKNEFIKFNSNFKCTGNCSLRFYILLSSSPQMVSTSSCGLQTSSIITAISNLPTPQL